MDECSSQFEKRKRDHIRISLDPRSQATGASGLDSIRLIHEALPELNFQDISINTKFGVHCLKSPLFISSMTAGHEEGVSINRALAQLSQERQILMGVGSQRRELTDISASSEWKEIRRDFPGAFLLANVGISQVIKHSTTEIIRLIENVGAVGLFVHLNALQECLQPEGTPEFRGAFQALEALVKVCPVPVIIKETGCGFSEATLVKLSQLPLGAIDLSGLGGTHWGRVEGYRSDEDSLLYQVAHTFSEWGHSTVDSLKNSIELKGRLPIWASGGIRNGLDIIKVMAMGAKMAGMAQPILARALQSGDVNANLHQLIDKIEYEMKVALFCTGTADLAILSQKRVWEWQKN